MRQRNAGFRTSWTRQKTDPVALDRRRRVVVQEKAIAAEAAAAEDPYSIGNFRQFYYGPGEIVVP